MHRTRPARSRCALRGGGRRACAACCVAPGAAAASTIIIFNISRILRCARTQTVRLGTRVPYLGTLVRDYVGLLRSYALYQLHCEARAVRSEGA